MSVTTEPGFYDERMVADDAPSMLPLEDSPWRPLYVEAAMWIPKAHPVVDLGCGTGRFLRCLEVEGHEGERAGVDFSAAAVTEALGYLGADAATLELVDLRDWQPDPRRAGHTTYTCLEVLEHLDDDLGLIERIPPGHQVVFSVPNYESEAHLRWFRGPGAAEQRYGMLLSLRRWSLIRLDERKAIHLFDSTRRTGSW